jgi:hypothetical protein
LAAASQIPPDGLAAASQMPPDGLAAAPQMPPDGLAAASQMPHWPSTELGNSLLKHIMQKIATTQAQQHKLHEVTET